MAAQTGIFSWRNSAGAISTVFKPNCRHGMEKFLKCTMKKKIKIENNIGIKRSSVFPRGATAGSGTELKN